METTGERYHIQVDVQSTYVLEHSRPDDDHYVFAYTVTIQNTGTVTAQLRTRHWIITDANAKVQEVRGDGVVGDSRASLGRGIPIHERRHPRDSGRQHVRELPDDRGRRSPVRRADPPFSLSVPNLVH